MLTRCHFQLVYDRGCHAGVIVFSSKFRPSAMWLFRCLLSFLHFLLSLKLLLDILFQRISRFFHFYDAQRSSAQIRLDSEYLTKLPQHVSFVILESEISLKDVAQLIVWSIAMRIPYLSVYDKEGVVKKNAASLSSELIRKQKQIFAEESSEYTFVLRTKDNNFDCELASTQVCISLLSEEDGKGDIVEAAREFCMDVFQKQRAVKEMEPDLLHSLLKATSNIPDPDVALKFGDVPMVMGFLPWQTRLTEFLQLKTHLNVSYSTFLSTLRRFCQCKQRFGK